LAVVACGSLTTSATALVVDDKTLLDRRALFALDTVGKHDEIEGIEFTCFQHEIGLIANLFRESVGENGALIQLVFNAFTLARATFVSGVRQQDGALQKLLSANFLVA
jgi:hypothetical protein